MGTIKNPFGPNVSYTANRDGSLNLDSAWKSRHIGSVFVPQLKGVPTYGGAKFSGNVTFYKEAMPQLLAAFAVIEKLGFLNDVIFWDGSFVPRYKRGSRSSPSNHSLGTAFDINAEWNGFRQRPALPGTKGSVNRLLPIFRSLSWTCGADWKNTPDGMHFEINRILNDAEIAAAVKSLLAGKAVAPSPFSKAVPVATRREPLFLLNDFALSTSQNRDGTLWVPVDDVAQALGVKGERIDGRYFAPVRQAIGDLGCSITNVGDHLADKGRFYMYASKETK